MSIYQNICIEGCFEKKIVHLSFILPFCCSLCVFVVSQHIRYNIWNIIYFITRYIMSGIRTIPRSFTPKFHLFPIVLDAIINPCELILNWPLLSNKYKYIYIYIQFQVDGIEASPWTTYMTFHCLIMNRFLSSKLNGYIIFIWNLRQILFWIKIAIQCLVNGNHYVMCF